MVQEELLKTAEKKKIQQDAKHRQKKIIEAEERKEADKLVTAMSMMEVQAEMEHHVSGK